jgi:hypothetical protein
MNISLFENATFLELVSEFNEYELVIKREKELYSIKIVINNIEYNSSNSNLDECIRDLIVGILENKAQEKSIMIEELINEWKTLEEIIEEIKTV